MFNARVKLEKWKEECLDSKAAREDVLVSQARRGDIPAMSADTHRTRIRHVLGRGFGKPLHPDLRKVWERQRPAKLPAGKSRTASLPFWSCHCDCLPCHGCYIQSDGFWPLCFYAGPRKTL
jgi:hypothetical protein